MTLLSLEEGYAALEKRERDWVAEGRVPSGWKVGLTSSEAQRRIGTDRPCFGRLFSDMAAPNESTIEWGRFGKPRVEAEIAFRLAKGVEPGDAAKDVIDATLPAIEIVDSRYPEGPAGPGELVADNVSGAGFVLGDPMPFQSNFDFEGCRADVARNGKLERSGRGSACLGSPLSSFAWLVAELADRGRRLDAGDVVLTGSLIAPLAIEPGDGIHIDFQGLSSVAISFAEAP